MRINVAQLLRAPIGSSSSYQVDDAVGKEGARHVKGEITLSRTGRGIMVKATITAYTTDICSRCLNPADYALKFDVAEEFLPRDAVSAGMFRQENLDTSTIIDEDNVLDLSEVIRQYTLLATPTKPLCKPECAGLCPACGHELNNEPCECPSQISVNR
ncbi:MAG: DUF177 domain-containing protein [Chloroflexi bacterium]|nr:DUF177 domain-containing protein [Chloroflexota bacterium]MBM3153759.1 DUF177 domain-containing protein [Chloroflexota bacterium]MBM3173043.1 DUF177 domain-containing protein [Chloroflexota bacterium]MBM3174153.1 DUF177 domain-containing protein [Chloroflexota bacterium]MBM4449221.1 DUF177 domain-containing protein [Chloroflexota bacterium]